MSMAAAQELLPSLPMHEQMSCVATSLTASTAQHSTAPSTWQSVDHANASDAVRCIEDPAASDVGP